MWCDIFSGWVAGMMGFAVGHPIDTVKVQQQIKGVPAMIATKYIYAKRGIKGFYQGISLPFFTNGFLNAIFFGVYGPVCESFVSRRTSMENVFTSQEGFEQGDMEGKSGKSLKYRVQHFEFKPQISPENLDATYKEMFLAGCVAGFFQSIFLSPIDLVKVKLQSQFKNHPNFNGPTDCFRKIFREAGVHGLYKGIMPLALRDIPGSGVYVAAYEFLRYELEFIYGFPKLFAQSMAGGVAGTVSWAVVIPFDVIKSRMQADDHMNPKYTGMRQCMSEIFKEKGIKGLFRGFWSASLRAFPVNACTFLCYQRLLDHCKEKGPNSPPRNLM